MVGRVIGKGGETIKAMQREFQANIQIDQTSLPMKITISGQPASVERAYAVVAEIVAGGNPYIGGSVGHAGTLSAFYTILACFSALSCCCPQTVCLCRVLASEMYVCACVYAFTSFICVRAGFSRNCCPPALLPVVPVWLSSFACNCFLSKAFAVLEFPLSCCTGLP